MKFAIVGTGYVSDFYLTSLPYHPQLELTGVFDQDPARARIIAARAGVRQYESLEAILNDPSVQIVVNLTSPQAHHAISRAALLAGKHVYSEKPLATTLTQSNELIELARAQNRLLSCAPCSLLGESAQTLWRHLRAGAIGKPQLVYAEMDDGPIHQMHPDRWRSESGLPWPWESEFDTGCTMEHAAYITSWLVAFFGPARTVSGMSAQVVPEKMGVAQTHGAPDFSVGCIEFASGVIARLTHSIVAPRNRSLLISGDAGYITMDELWNYDEPFQIRTYHGMSGPRKEPARTLRQRWRRKSSVREIEPIKVPTAANAPAKPLATMDYCRGIAELAAAAVHGTPLRLSAELGHHLTELSLALQNLGPDGASIRIESDFDAIAPMPWAA